MNIINFTKPETGNFLVDIILWLVQISSSIFLGVVLFTLILKLITLPFDYASRASMRKNSLKMEQMRPELEKLQKQYADNKDLYNQKMLALYKKNGYSMFGACLPTILTLVIFIVALNGFSAYSRYQNKKYFYDMSLSYNNVIYAGLEEDKGETAYIIRDEEGKPVVKLNELYEIITDENTDNDIIKGTNKDGEEFIINVENNGSALFISTENGYTVLRASYQKNETGIKWDVEEKFSYDLIEGAILSTTLLTEENNYLKDCNGKTYEEAKSENAELTEEQFINSIRADKSAETFREENENFLWVKNIWVSDSPFKHPVETDWTKFITEQRYIKDQTDANNIGQENYDLLISKLDKEKTQANGYFILVALTAGVSLLSQIVIGKSQQAQMELQTVDGQGAQTQKVMKWMMPIMMAIFAFMYTAAFSIYIVLSSLLSLGTTFLINFFVDRKFKKQEAAQETQKIRGRVYTPKEQPKEEKQEPKKKKDDKFAHENGEDYLSMMAKKDQKQQKQHIRGRLK